MSLRFYSALIVLFFFLTPAALAQQALTIQDCISLARENNPRLVQSRTSIQRANAGVTLAHSSYYPTFDLSSRYRNTETFSGEREGSYSTSISLDYPLYRGGYRRAAVKAALVEVDVAEESYRFSESQVVLEVKQAFFKILQKEEQIALTEDMVNRRNEDLVLIRLKYDSGRESLPAVEEAAASILRAEYEKKRAEEELALAKIDLNLLLSRPRRAEVSLEYTSNEAEMPSLAVLIEEAKAERSELRSEKANTGALEAQVIQARSSYFPTVSLSSSLGWQGSEFLEQTNDWSFGVNLSLPIFDGFSTKVKVQQATLSLENQEARIREVEEMIEEEIEQAYSTWELARSIIEVNERTLEAARNMYRLTKLQYEQGLSSYFFLQQKESDLTQAENSKLDALFNLRVSRARLEKTLGRIN
ncbi:MAG: TolC family protein [Candidatus Eiseniibacteriota bacterium]|nr:MAG: TolC family protein [Candidatus Eisenbacteria bacterium]